MKGWFKPLILPAMQAELENNRAWDGCYLLPIYTAVWQGHFWSPDSSLNAGWGLVHFVLSHMASKFHQK